MSAQFLPKGFLLATAQAGFKQAGRPDLALVVSQGPASAAGVFTTNLFKAAPVQVATSMLIACREARAIVINTGQANACTGETGMANCCRTQELIAAATNLTPQDVLPASTGVIGVQLKMDLWEKAISALVANLGKATVEEFATAIMTTDRFPKFTSEQLTLGGKKVTLTGVAKGAGMICPNMATMISVVLCDADIATDVWQGMFDRAVTRTFNRVTVDGDTSTNDTLFGLANGASGVRPQGEALLQLEKALTRILATLAYALVEDGEGATKVMHISIRGARDNADAEKAARAVGQSPLVKTAMYGKDANWGRIVAALGRSGADFHPRDVRVSLCGVELFRDEQPTNCDFDTLLKKPLQETDLQLDIILGAGPGAYTLLASDLTHAYIDINADYRS